MVGPYKSVVTCYKIGGGRNVHIGTTFPVRSKLAKLGEAAELSHACGLLDPHFAGDCPDERERGRRKDPGHDARQAGPEGECSSFQRRGLSTRPVFSAHLLHSVGELASGMAGWLFRNILTDLHA